jgi:predicted nuclease of predicted toxin-antitoxin system
VAAPASSTRGLKLLLDAMFEHEIARQLRRRGHDVLVATERPAWADLTDPELFAVAQGETRAVVTENVGDFVQLDARYRARSRSHHGIILTTDRRFRRGTAGSTGRLVLALDRLLRTPEGWPTGDNRIIWLR